MDNIISALDSVHTQHSMDTGLCLLTVSIDQSSNPQDQELSWVFRNYTGPLVPQHIEDS